MIGYWRYWRVLVFVLVYALVGGLLWPQTITSDDLNYLLTSCAKLKAQLASLRAELLILKNSSTELEKQLTDLQDRLAALSRDLEVSRRESALLTERLTELSSAFEKLKAEARAAMAETTAWKWATLASSAAAVLFLTWAILK